MVLSFLGNNFSCLREGIGKRPLHGAVTLLRVRRKFREREHPFFPGHHQGPRLPTTTQLASTRSFGGSQKVRTSIGPQRRTLWQAKSEASGIKVPLVVMFA